VINTILEKQVEVVQALEKEVFAAMKEWNSLQLKVVKAKDDEANACNNVTRLNEVLGREQNIMYKMMREL